MLKYFWRFLSWIIIPVLLSCSKPLPSFDNFDATAWKGDVEGCRQIRPSLVESLYEQKSKLLSLDEIEVTKVLGKPDRSELYKRNQKFFYYFVEPSPDCEQPADQPRKLVIRFNAVGLAKEVNLE